ncbi:galactokinase [Panacibacter ginsenosidivorans]|uniref:Galactokinase n=1 Tax=Panacibacter ginsenosidivorans TaxID=1813871 RepID=A0A5B8VDV6_9BACT|nr:galactokinase [Panacibacter ginsenosidivorans]QEC69687.1 galactokinase [Panacibacter ginsenosidivorans]
MSKLTQEVSATEKKYSIPEKLKSYINKETLVVRSPGRINLIGEHTDYNEGFVLPAAIDKAAWVAITPRKDNIIHLFSVDLGEEYETTTSALIPSLKHAWYDYILGVTDQFKKTGFTINGFDAALTADIPIGAGLSSSAAIECAVAFALNEWLQAGLTKLEMVKIAQKAENEYVGLQCGIMDMFASMFGKQNHVIKLDCRSLEYQYEPLNLDGYKVILFDTNVKHTLASSQYNVRRQQCETGVSLVQQHISGINSLRDVDISMLNKYVQPQNKEVYQRCRFVVEEIERLQEACIDLEKNDIEAFGLKMYETHMGLSNLYEVSCSELDFLVDYVKNNPAVAGARMMGGGFGGCTINLVKNEAVDELTYQLKAAYAKAMRKELKVYVAQIGSGTARIN